MAATSFDGSYARRGGERPLYTTAALTAALIVFAGFAPSYYLKTVFAAPDLDTLRHVHGVVMTLWFAFVLMQARLVATGRTAIHRQLGVAGIFLAVVVVFVGTSLGIASARAGHSPVAGVSPLVFLVLPLGEMVTFAVLVTAAIALRRRSDWHKRFMLLASLAIMAPAFARFPWERLGIGGPPVFFGATDLVILGCIAYDAVKNRRLHPAFAIGLAIVLVGQAGRLVLSQTPLWMRFAQWVAS